MLTLTVIRDLEVALGMEVIFSTVTRQGPRLETSGLSGCVKDINLSHLCHFALKNTQT